MLFNTLRARGNGERVLLLSYDQFKALEGIHFEHVRCLKERPCAVRYGLFNVN